MLSKKSNLCIVDNRETKEIGKNARNQKGLIASDELLLSAIDRMRAQATQSFLD